MWGDIVVIFKSRISETEAKEILDFALFLQMKRNTKDFKDLEIASQTSCEFWNNDIEDEFWNNALTRRNTSNT